MVKGWEKSSLEVLELYAVLRRLNDGDQGPGYPSSSIGGGGVSTVSDRTGTIAVRQAENGPSDPVLQLLIEGESMIFTLIALLGLPSALHPNGEGLVAWMAQTFLQLVLLSVIMVGQDVQSKSAEARDIETHDTVMAEMAEIKELIAMVDKSRRSGPKGIETR
jgi:hypothetical protein